MNCRTGEGRLAVSRWIQSAPLRDDRSKAVASGALEGGVWRVPVSFFENGLELYEAYKDLEFEGIACDRREHVERWGSLREIRLCFALRKFSRAPEGDSPTGTAWVVRQSRRGVEDEACQGRLVKKLASSGYAMLAAMKEAGYFICSERIGFRWWTQDDFAIAKRKCPFFVRVIPLPAAKSSLISPPGHSFLPTRRSYLSPVIYPAEYVVSDRTPSPTIQWFYRHCRSPVSCRRG